MWRHKNPEKAKSYSKKWSQNNKETVQTWRINNRERLNAYGRQYAAANPNVIKAISERRRARKANAPINDLTAAQWERIKTAYGYKCVYCGRKMERLTQDHITPISKGGSHTVSNIVPACRSCNSKKGTGAPLTPVQPLLFVI